MRNHTPSGLRNARKLRKRMTLPEVLLWQSLKSRPQGLKFRKQHPIGDLVADFYCDASKTVIEIDGIVHEMGAQPERDLRRDTVLQAEGYRVIRIAAVEVLHDPAAVAARIAAVCAKPRPLRQPCGLPPPPVGEDR